MNRKLINWIGLTGLAALISYAAAAYFCRGAFQGYNWMESAVIDLSAEQLLTGEGIDEDFTRHNDMEVSFEDKEMLVEYHGLGEEQQKRVVAYLKTLKKLEDLENI